MLRNAVLAAAITAFCIPMAFGDDTKNETPAAEAKGKQSSDADANIALTPEKFLNKLHAVSQEEIKLGKLAQERGESQEVKTYGQMLIQDHQKADQQIMQTAKAQNIQLMEPKEPADATKSTDATEGQKSKPEHADHHDAAYRKLSGLSGKEFDKEFVTCMVKDHDKALDMMDKARTQSNLAPVKDLAEKLRPTFQTHMQKAETLASNLGVQVPGTSKSARANIDRDANRNVNPNTSPSQNAK